MPTPHFWARGNARCTFAEYTKNAHAPFQNLPAFAEYAKCLTRAVSRNKPFSKGGASANLQTSTRAVSYSGQVGDKSDNLSARRFPVKPNSAIYPTLYRRAVSGCQQVAKLATRRFAGGGRIRPIIFTMSDARRFFHKVNLTSSLDLPARRFPGPPTLDSCQPSKKGARGVSHTNRARI